MLSIRIPIYYQLKQLSFREQMAWACSLMWGVGLALFTIWWYIPYCRRKMVENKGSAVAVLYRIALYGSIVFFAYQFIIVCGAIVWCLVL